MLESPQISRSRELGPIFDREAPRPDDPIISIIDGKPYKSLKRHLSTHGLTPEQYRERYGLKSDYPMVAESYAEKRRPIAKQLGLGRKPRQSTTAAPAADAKAPRGRRKKQTEATSE
jgi:predicted transcriptional regulator